MKGVNYALGMDKLQLRYKDASGAQTRRIVVPAGFTATCLYGLCELRGERRSFRLDRIDQVVNLTTGEIYSTHKDLINDLAKA